MQATPEAQPLPVLARRCWGALETLHVVAYFAPEPRHAYKALGLRSRSGYFASRSAAMGPVPAGTTTATFYVFSPTLVGEAMAGVWAAHSPAELLEARHGGVAAALHGALGEPDVTEALELARAACAGLRPHGRALYAAHAALPEPAEPLLALWHAASLLREHRGDGHVAALLTAGLDPLEAIITGGIASGTTDFMKLTRGWTDEEWLAGEERLRGRGLVDDAGALTERGTALRADVEARTDALALEGWERLGADGTARLLELVRPLRKALLSSEVFPPWLFARR